MGEDDERRGTRRRAVTDSDFLRSWAKPLALAALITVSLILFGDATALQVIGGMVVSVGGTMLVDWNWRRHGQQRRDQQGSTDEGIS